jgi:hypothetical protein
MLLLCELRERMAGSVKETCIFANGRVSTTHDDNGKLAIMTMSVSHLTHLRWPPLTRSVFFTALCGALVALVLEPDHTKGLPILVAFGLWFTHIFFAVGLYLLCAALAIRLELPRWIALALPLLVLPLVFAPISLLLDYGLGNPDEGDLTLSSFPSLYVEEIVAVAPLVTVLALISAYIARGELFRNHEPEVERPGTNVTRQPASPRLSELFEDVPARLGDDLIRIAAQDHYVEIVTANGRILVTNRFSDCVVRLGRYPGLQCHRSHWINLNHIKNVERSGSTYDCIMSNGDRVPVSRRRWGDLKKRRNSGTGVPMVDLETPVSTSSD